MPRARLRHLATTPTGAVLALGVSLLGYVVVTLNGTDPFAMIDLRVYYEGAQHLGDDSTLYTFESSALGLPFTYPPFAAVLFATFGWLPWPVCQVLWQLGSFGAVAVICHASLRLTEEAQRPRSTRDRRCLTVVLTAAAVWMEPVRSTLNFGQINLFLAAVLLGGLLTCRSWITGVGVGVCTAVKLVPGITVLFYLLARRTWVVVTAAVATVAAAGVGAVIAPRSTRTFFTVTMFDPARAGNVPAVNNQSLRGALARILGADHPAVWAGAVVLALVLGVCAARACLRADDRLGGFLVVQLIGLLVSPISWNHHWVWVLPLIIWATCGPLRRTRIVATLAVLWLVAVLSFVISIQIALEQHHAGLHLTWAAAVYPALGLVTIVGVWFGHRQPRSLSVAPVPAVESGVGRTRT